MADLLAIEADFLSSGASADLAAALESEDADEWSELETE